MDDALQEAILTAGSRRALARLLDTSHQALALWRRVPAERVLDVERVTGIPRSRLRPDLYPDVDIVLSTSPPIAIEAKTDEDALRRVTQRAAARAVYSLLAREPDLLGERDAVALGRQLGTLLYEEMRQERGDERTLTVVDGRRRLAAALRKGEAVTLTVVPTPEAEDLTVAPDTGVPRKAEPPHRK